MKRFTPTFKKNLLSGDRIYNTLDNKKQDLKSLIKV